MKLPLIKKIAHLPTPIYELETVNKELEDVKLYIKRDDFTGVEYSGNKVRKLECIIPDVLEQQCGVLITCGGIQSNHCRATASVAAKLGLKSHIVLKGDLGKVSGNFFLDKMFDAKCDFITDEEYKNNRSDYMKQVKNEYASLGLKAYIIPEGASNGLGMFGYYLAMEEILKQEKEMNVKFDTICIATGSGGTYAGLYLANEYLGSKKNIVGINIYDKAKDFHKIVPDIIEEGLNQTGNSDILQNLNYNNIQMINDYIDLGYGISTPEELTFIKSFAKKEGIVLDPVYTGKAMNGLVSEIEKGSELLKGNVLFIHTGGLFGAFSRIDEFYGKE